MEDLITIKDEESRSQTGMSQYQEFYQQHQYH